MSQKRLDDGRLGSVVDGSSRDGEVLSRMQAAASFLPTAKELKVLYGRRFFFDSSYDGMKQGNEYVDFKRV